MTKVAINGFGRIGRQAFKIALEKPDEIEIVAINDLMPPEVIAHLLMYDSNYGSYDKKVSVEIGGEMIDMTGNRKPQHTEGYQDKEVYLHVDDKNFRIYSIPNPTDIPWGNHDVDVVLECTGIFTKDGKAAMHLEAGAKRVVVSAPTKGGDVATYLMGVNTQDYEQDGVVSNGSCTTNCVGPVTAVMMSAFGVEKAMMTTIHSYTASQMLVDGYSRGVSDYRRMRAAAENIVPTTTGAAISTTEAIPELKGKFDGSAVRVPTQVGSLTDFIFLTKSDTSVEKVNQAFIDAAETNPMFKHVLKVTSEPLVSSDIIGNTASAIVDLQMTNVVDGNMVKVMAWYDNEMGYSNRLIEMAVEVSKNL